MNTCPNPNSPEWKSLVEKLGEGHYRELKPQEIKELRKLF